MADGAAGHGMAGDEAPATMCAPGNRRPLRAGAG